MNGAGNTTTLFQSSPFTLTASPANAACWAGRREIHKRLERICASFLRRPDSSLDMIWANFGCGKSHALFHLQHLLQKPGTESALVSAFVEMPEQINHFIELYRRIVASLSLKQIASTVTAAQNSELNSNLLRAASILLHGGHSEKSLATQWLNADRPNLRDLKATGIDSRIEDDQTACDVISDIVTAIATRGGRLVILLDEFQRVSVLKDRQRNTILSNLRSIFSRNATGFSLVLAAGFRIERSAMELLPQELRTLMGVRPAVSLPEMSKEEAREFVLERLQFFRPSGYSGPEAAPFGIEVIERTISYLESKGSGWLIPRTLLQSLAYAYDEASIDSKSLDMDSTAVVQLLDDLNWEN